MWLASDTDALQLERAHSAFSIRIQFEIDLDVVVPAGAKTSRQRIDLGHTLANSRDRLVDHDIAGRPYDFEV